MVARPSSLLGKTRKKLELTSFPMQEIYDRFGKISTGGSSYTSENEIIDIINKLNPSKAPRYDDIPTKLIKAAKFSFAPFLNNIFNSCLNNGLYPDELKIARVIPLHKGGSNSELKNYRPISILSTLNKIFETIIKQRLITFWTTYNVFVPTQFGFRENRSTTLAIAHLHELIMTELDNDRSVCTIFMDLAKAFDTVNHNIFLFKLEQYGVRGVANNLLSSYLSNRKQFVHGDGFSSSLLDIDIGVLRLQGSVLGPILFLIYINDLYYCSDFKTTLYADDNVLTLSHKNVNRLQYNLNVELCKIHAWLNYNQLSLNIAKTNYYLFTKKLKR